jgi:hypothetical protein
MVDRYSVFELRNSNISGNVDVTGRIYGVSHKNHKTTIKLAHNPRLSEPSCSNPYILVIYKDELKKDHNFENVSADPSESGLQKRVLVIGKFIPHLEGFCLGTLEAIEVSSHLSFEEKAPSRLSF